jgi:hypothetical protein
MFDQKAEGGKQNGGGSTPSTFYFPPLRLLPSAPLLLGEGRRERSERGARAVVFCLLLSFSSLPLFAATTVTSVSPSLGINSGGTTVQITGSGFTGATVVAFNGTNATTYTVVSDTTISAVAPNVGAVTGAISVLVTSPSGTNAGNTLFTYTSPNQNVQIAVTVTVNKQANIQWGAGTSNDDTPAVRALTILPFTWIVKDPQFGAANQVTTGTTYFSNDATNNKTITISNVSKTNSSETITAITSDSANWKAAAAPAANVFEVQASIDGGTTYQVLGTDTATAVTLTNNLVKGTDQTLVFQFSTPTTISAASAAVQQTIVISLMATAN